ncbi:MAG: DUF1501 domain-containing protein [bacterium]|nr:DUF1501 domain-containing protein [bacterium]
MNEEDRLFETLSRRHFLTRTSLGLGAAALGSLVNPRAAHAAGRPGVLTETHFPAKAKRVIYLFQSGGPSQMELLDYKPKLAELHGQQLPDSVRQGQRLTGMSAGQSSFPLAESIFSFERRGECGAWVSELLPHTAKVIDELCVIRSMHTEAINHDPAITFFQTGSQLPGRPSMGAWVSYGLGSDNDNLPEFIVLVSKNGSGQPLYARLWGSGFLPTRHQGVQFRAGTDPVLYLNDPEGYSRDDRARMLSTLNELNQAQYDAVHDPEILDRMAQYEMAFRMQTSIPGVMDLSNEPDSIFELYGPGAKDPGSYAYNCLLARRLAERDVKFIQLYHQGWDQHGDLPKGIQNQCKATDQATAALIADLKQRGLLEDTLVIWGGEFGRTNYSQGALTADNYGRDHHPRCFTVWMAGAGVKKGLVYGETDELGYNVVRNPVHVHDLQATILYLLGVDHERLTYKYQGRRFRLTDVSGEVVKDILA